MKSLATADEHIWITFQGEGVLFGEKTIFVRLAGCSVGCFGCDTSYESDKKETNALEIAQKIKLHSNYHTFKWIWITGGEPTDYDLSELCWHIRNLNREKSIAIATSGIRRVDAVYDFISVSPHFHPDKLTVHSGNQINLVPGLGELNLDDWHDFDFYGFENKFITPFSNKKDFLHQCQKWINKHPEFRLGVQAHKVWGVA